MAAKPEPEAPEAETPAGTSPEAAKTSVLGALLPALLVVVLTPALTWAVARFVLIPGFKKELAAVQVVTPSAASANESGRGGESKKGKGEPASLSNGYTFENIVVNLAGTMGTRYLKTTFYVTGSEEGIKATFEANRAQLVDVTLNVLSSLTLPDLEEAGARNIIREKLIQSYNQVFGRKVAEQVFFSDFVVQ